MKEKDVFFNEVALLVTHYNRSQSLERLLKAFADRQICFKEVIVSDDGSDTSHLNRLNQLKQIYDIKLVCTDKNKGLANNINKGQKTVSAPYTLYIQEDFIPGDKFRQSLKDGLAIMEENPAIDLVRFYAYRKHPYLKPLQYHFSEMEFHFWRPNFWQFFCYSDHPHLRKSNFLTKFGNYHEGINSDKAEYLMMISFLKKKGKAIIHNAYREVFSQENSEQEPSRVGRKKFKKYIQLTDFFFIKVIRNVYRNVKFRMDYLFLN